jgi:FAD/FMN-containing dehydrogenase
VSHGPGRIQVHFLVLKPRPARGTVAYEMAIETQAASLETTGLDFHGELVAPGDPGYDDARRIWNGAIDRRPGLIARCTGVADVVAAVRFARERDLLVAVHGGGTGSAGTPSARAAQSSTSRR